MKTTAAPKQKARNVFYRLAGKIFAPKPKTIKKTVWCPNRKRECETILRTDGRASTHITDVAQCPAMDGYETSCNRACLTNINSNSL